MPSVQSEGIRINYTVEGEGSPILLHHGLTGSSADWSYRHYVDALRDDYKLIRIDARGHGLSDKPHDPEAYRLEAMVNDVRAILDDLGINRVHYWGYSMGGRVGFGMARYALDRLKSLTIGGFSHHDRTGPSPMLPLFQQDVEAIIAGFKQELGDKWLPQIEEQIRALDLKAIVAYCLSDGRFGLVASLPKVNVPCLVYAGEMDPVYNNVRESAMLLPDASFVSLPGVDHLSAWSRTDLVLPHVLAFLEKVESVAT